MSLFLYMDLFQAFLKAWKTACGSTGAPVLLVPKKNYLVKPITFSGPCKSQLTMQVINENSINHVTLVHTKFKYPFFQSCLEYIYTFNHQIMYNLQ